MTQAGPVSGETEKTTSRAIGREVGTGLGWSFLNNCVGRLGNFLAGVVIIRHLAQAEYGIYAIGLVVLAILLSMNELGVSVAVVQHRGRVEDIAPTVMTISVVSSVAMAGIGFVLAPIAAAALGTPEATGLIRLLLVSVLLDGVASVPNALMTRMFQQRKRLQIDTVAFVVGTPLAIFLAVAGHGAWSLGWGAIVGNLVSAGLAMLWTPVRVRPGWDPRVLRGLLGFGLPLAGASLLSLLILNVDFMVVGHTLGPIELGLYVLAFNLCSWPITVVTSAIRRVAVALFARLAEHTTDGGRADFARVFGLVLGITVPLCVLLAGFADVLIKTLYGGSWLPAALALAPLAVLSLVRVAVEVAYDFLAGSGRTRSTVWLHAIWLVALVPALTIGARMGGIRGVAIGHAVVAVFVVGTTLAILLRRSGVALDLVVRRLGLAGAGAGVMSVVIVLSRLLLGAGVAALVVGSVVAGLAYLLCLWPLRKDATELWNLRTGDGVAS